MNQDASVIHVNAPARRSVGKPSVGSVVQAIAVLRYLSKQGRGSGVTNIANSLSISPSSCYNILKTLVAEEFLDFDCKDKTYRLGIGAVDLGRQALGTSNLFPALGNHLQNLSDQYNLAMGLWRLTNRKRFVLIEVVESEQVTRIHMSVSQRVPLLTGAIGRCYAATRQLSQQQIARELDGVRWQMRPTIAEYLRQVEQARISGWAIDAGQWRRGVTTIAAPIMDTDGIMRFGITGSMFSSQHDHAEVQSICETMRGLAVHASRRAYGIAPETGSTALA